MGLSIILDHAEFNCKVEMVYAEKKSSKTTVK